MSVLSLIYFDATRCKIWNSLLTNLLILMNMTCQLFFTNVLYLASSFICFSYTTLMLYLVYLKYLPGEYYVKDEANYFCIFSLCSFMHKQRGSVRCFFSQ